MNTRIAGSQPEIVRIVSVQELQKVMDPYKKPAWGYYRILKRSMIKSAIENNQLTPSPVLNNSPILVHAKRVAYFVANGWATPIQVLVTPTPDNLQPMGITSVLNGLHRLAAAIYLGHTEIRVTEVVAGTGTYYRMASNAYVIKETG
jgi:hypothetical protein